MSSNDSHFQVDVGSERNFGLVFAIVFTLIGLLPVLSGSGPRWVFILIAAVFAALALFRPASLKIPNLLWFKFGMLLGAIVAPIVMFLIFLVAFVPIGILIRLSGKELMALQGAPETESYWIEREAKPNSMKLQY